MVVVVVVESRGESNCLASREMSQRKNCTYSSREVTMCISKVEIYGEVTIR